MVRPAIVGKGSDRARRRLAWTLPVVVAGAVAAGVALNTAASSNASPNLAPRTAAQLLTAVQTSTATTLSGTIHESADLGLPSLPTDQSNASLSWQTFITGTHSARVWVSGADKQRIALIGELSEADVVHNGTDLWTYTSADNTVTHTTLKRGAERGTEPSKAPTAGDYTPAGAAARALKAVSPTTSVTVDAAQRVAGRNAYILAIRPRDTHSTIRKVTIAIDATKFVPLRVQVFGAASKPAFETGFSTISFATPPASIFRFHTPAGATTSNDPLGTHGGRVFRHDGELGRAAPVPLDSAAAAKPTLIESGWTSVVELSGGLNGVGGLLGQLTSSVGTAGARLLHTSLINAVLLPDGRVFVGAVSPAFLEHVAATTAH